MDQRRSSPCALHPQNWDWGPSHLLNIILRWHRKRTAQARKYEKMPSTFFVPRPPRRLVASIQTLALICPEQVVLAGRLPSSGACSPRPEPRTTSSIWPCRVAIQSPKIPQSVHQCSNQPLGSLQFRASYTLRTGIGDHLTCC